MAYIDFFRCKTASWLNYEFRRGVICTFKKAILAVLALVLAGASVISKAQSEFKGKALVVMSSANELALKDDTQYKTGYYLNEFEVPYKKLIEAGCTPVIARVDRVYA